MVVLTEPFYVEHDEKTGNHTVWDYSLHREVCQVTIGDHQTNFRWAKRIAKALNSKEQ